MICEMIKSKIFLPLLLTALMIFGCKENPRSSEGLSKEQLEAAYIQYKEASLTDRRFKQADIAPLIKSRSDDFLVEELGESIQEREIYQLAYGKGSTKVMLWSQMHGNESTATMALFDLFNFLEGRGDGFDSIRNPIRDQLNIRFIPMVNPDGAEKFRRRNALDIDLNRDALDESTPEAVLLKAARENFQPSFGFNLHDQQIYYNVKGSRKPATISVLAPAYNEETEVNTVREKSMQLIVGMNQMLQQIVPGQVGKYDDAFEPRAFGDNFQKWGTSTILIESGGYPNDPEKQYIRQLNFMVILDALYAIATQNYEQYVLEDYYAIPDNDSKLMDLILRKVSVELKGKYYQVDLGINRREVELDSGFLSLGSITDKGDLSVYYGYEEIHAEGFHYRQGNIWKGGFESLDHITQEKALELLKQGYMGIVVSTENKGKLHRLPLVVVTQEKAFRSGHQIGGAANFFLQQGEEVRYAIVNGFLIDLKALNPTAGLGLQQVL